MKKFKAALSVLLTLIFLSCNSVFALEYEQVIQSLSQKFNGFLDPNEGLTTFRSLYVPCGGRSEAMGSAFTALANDLTYIDYNPAASCNLDNSELGIAHNSWISDSSMDSIAYTFRKHNFGFGAQIKCFYVEFIERDMFEDVAKDYYSETVGALNFSYNFFSGYTFKGLAVGVNLKCAYRDMPNYTDNDTGKLIAGSGLLQSAVGIMGDVGIQMRFNLGKFYSALEPNFNIGVSVSNLGVAFTNLGSGGSPVLDDPLCSRVSAGLSYRPIKPLTLAVEFQQPINLFNTSLSEKWAIGCGAMVQCTDFFALEAGFLLRGANPRFSLGAEFLYRKYILNLNYTFDTTSSTAPVNRISVSAKINLGDGGRAEEEKKIIQYYNIGLEFYAKGDMENAIAEWKKVLKINPFYDPAITGIQSAKNTLKLQERINAANFFD